MDYFLIICLFILIIILLLCILTMKYFKKDSNNEHQLNKIWGEIILLKSDFSNVNDFIKKIYDDLNKK